MYMSDSNKLQHTYNLHTVNDPSAGSPTETLLRLLLPLNDQVWASLEQKVVHSFTHTPNFLLLQRPH